MYEVIGNIKEVVEGVEWEIGDFLSLQEYYESPPLSFAAASWVLGIEVCHTRDGRYIDFRLERRSPGPPPIHLKFSYSVRSRGGRKYQGRQRTHVFNTNGSSYADSDYFELDSQRVSEWAPQGTLTVLCTLRDMERDAGEHSRSEINVPHHINRILRDLKQLYLSQEDCDVVIRVKEREFKAHRSILKSRSPVFASTLRSDMQEKATGIVDIQDLDPSTFSDFLCFLYCAELDNLSEENVFGLFTAADKYDVQDLRAKCVEYMKANLSVDTFCDVIRLALLHSETELIRMSTDFFINNASEIITTVKWQTFVVENPVHGNELFIKYVNRNT